MENKYELERIKGTVQLPINKGINIKWNKNDLNLYFMSDLHSGAMECNYELLNKAIDVIAKDKNGLVIVGGDTIEAIPRGYKINEDGQHCGIDAQMARTINALKKIKDKTIVMFKGNHNSKSRGESIDSDLVIAQALDVPYKTVPTVITIRTPKGIVRAAGGHGRGASVNSDAELEKVQKIFPGCNIYFLGHDHSLYAKQRGALIYDAKGNEHWRPFWYVRTGNFLNYAEYARYAFYAPQRSGFIKMIIKNGEVVDGQAITDSDI